MTQLSGASCRDLPPINTYKLGRVGRPSLGLTRDEWRNRMILIWSGFGFVVLPMIGVNIIATIGHSHLAHMSWLAVSVLGIANLLFAVSCFAIRQSSFMLIPCPIWAIIFGIWSFAPALVKVSKLYPHVWTAGLVLLFLVVAFFGVRQYRRDSQLIRQNQTAASSDKDEYPEL